MTNYMPDEERGTMGNVSDRVGNKKTAYVGPFFYMDGYAYGVLIKEDEGDGWDCPQLQGIPNPIDFWMSQDEMQAAVGRTIVNPDGTKTVTGFGGMGNYEVAKVPTVQAIFDRTLNPAPVLPDHTNAELATDKGLGEVNRKFFVIIEDPTKTHAPTYKLQYQA